MCSKLPGRNTAQQNTLLETPVIIASLIPQFWITFTALDPKILPSVCMKYNMGFFITLDVNEMFLDGGIAFAYAS